MNQSVHYPVLLTESVDALIKDVDGVYVDGTFGRGGHSREILSRLSSKGQLIGFDKDVDAVAVGLRLKAEDARFDIVHGSFADVHNTLKERGLRADGVLLDLGVSSPQLDEAERGFSFMRDGPLDMRMDTNSGISAADWLAQTDVQDMVRVFKVYGEERFAKRIASRIASLRQEEPIVRTQQLADLIADSVPVKERHKHPATRVFQAIRIEINAELADLDLALAAAMKLLVTGGRFVVISFHSLEDRMVKRFFRKFSQSQDFPLGVPVTHDQLKAPLKIIGRAQKASEGELQENVRSRSAVMRVAERCE